MYSRYSGVSIPQNYGGSRFSHLAEVETKTHRPTTTVTPIKEKDDILLLGLILLLISDSSKDNYDVIMVLALLLVGGK